MASWEGNHPQITQEIIEFKPSKKRICRFWFTELTVRHTPIRDDSSPKVLAQNYPHAVFCWVVRALVGSVPHPRAIGSFARSWPFSISHSLPLAWLTVVGTHFPDLIRLSLLVGTDIVYLLLFIHGCSGVGTHFRFCGPYFGVPAPSINLLGFSTCSALVVHHLATGFWTSS